MKKLFVIFIGLSLLLTSCEPQDAMDLDHFTQEQIDVLQVLSGTFIVDGNAGDQLIILEKYNPPREILLAETVTIKIHGKIRLIPDEDDLPYEAYLDFNFYISKDGNNITLFAIGDLPLEIVLYIEVLSNTSFRMREYGDEVWNTFTKI